MKKNPHFTQIDTVLCDDQMAVMFYGYTAKETCFTQTIELPVPTSEENFVPAEWVAAALPDRWVCVG